MPRQSLADEISALLDPRPSGHADDDEDGLGLSARAEQKRHAGMLTEEERAGAAPQARRRLRAGIDLGSTGEKYSGRVTSRERLEDRNRLPRKRPPPQEEEEDDDDDEEEEMP